MHPILFTIGGFPIYSYGVMVALGFLLAVLWLLRECQKRGENAQTYLELLSAVTLVGFVCARLLYVIYFPELYQGHWTRALTDRGGLVWYGGLLGGTVAGILYVKLKHLSVWQYADRLVIPAGIGLAFGRIGCFLAGCCYGKAGASGWPGLVQFPVAHPTHPHWVHPVQLYESAAVALLVLAMMRLSDKHEAPPGFIATLFFVGYGVIRFLLEWMRGDVVYWVDHLLSASQVFSLIGVALGIGVLIFHGKRPKPVA